MVIKEKLKAYGILGVTTNMLGKESIEDWIDFMLKKISFSLI